MSHHSSIGDDFGRGNPAENIEKSLREEMKKLMGEYPHGRLNKDDAGAVAMAVGVESGKVILRFPKPIAWVGFTGDDAMELAQVLIKHARAAGLTAPAIIRVGE